MAGFAFTKAAADVRVTLPFSPVTQDGCSVVFCLRSIYAKGHPKVDWMGVGLRGGRGKLRILARLS